MNKTKIIDYIQILFWICVLVAITIGTMSYLEMGYVKWPVVFYTLIVTTISFGLIVCLREVYYFSSWRKNDPGFYLIGVVLIVSFIGLSYFGKIQEWTNYQPHPNLIVGIIVGIMAIIHPRYAIPVILIFAAKEYLGRFDLMEYLTNIGFGLGLILIYAGGKKVITLFVFRRWSDVLVKQERNVEQK